METAIVPALALLGAHTDTPEARVMLLASGLQESSFECRRQMGGGPACGYWQAELGRSKPPAGITGLWQHHTAHEPLRLLCHDRDVSFDPKPIWQALETDDVLAAGVARLLLLCDPHPLPELGDEQGAWDTYIRCWRPGKPRPAAWPVNYALALGEVKR
jgi:hypothetical protein